MRVIKYILLGTALGFISQAALAFQETNGKAAPQTSAPDLKLDDGKSGLGLPSRSTGPEIRIPGLGTIGALPKLDFGLELLYGAGEPKGGPLPDKNDTNDLQIRGTVKYKFNN